MNTEIKFRYVFKHKATGNLSMFILSIEEIEQYSSLSWAFFMRSGVPQSQWNKWELVSRDRYIGLKDKNDKEIYEGDKINFKANYSSKPCGRLEGKIVWDYDAFKFQSDSLEEPYSLSEESDEGSYQWEITGNIHNIQPII